jgi:hypothetical protein
MTKTKTWLLGATLLVGLMSGAAQATIYQTDSSFGTNTVVVDSNTGKQWLSLTLTKNMSYNDVNGQLATTFSGYHIASLGEVSQFIVDSGLPASSGIVAGENSVLDGFIKMWGITAIWYGGGGTENWIGAITSTVSPYAGSGYVVEAIMYEWFHWSGSSPETGWNTHVSDNQSLSTSESWYSGVALVKDSSSVPEPATLALTLAGFGLAALRRRPGVRFCSNSPLMNFLR